MRYEAELPSDRYPADDDSARHDGNHRNQRVEQDGPNVDFPMPDLNLERPDNCPEHGDAEDRTADQAKHCERSLRGEFVDELTRNAATEPYAQRCQRDGVHAGA